MANEQNLKPFKKGQSGNPNGRPKKMPEIINLIAETLAEEKNGITAAEAILMKWREMATKGNLKAGEMLLDRAYGKPQQMIDVLSDGKALVSPIINMMPPSE